jgi:hypothetical protein
MKVKFFPRLVPAKPMLILITAIIKIDNDKIFTKINKDENKIKVDPVETIQLIKIDIDKAIIF